MTKPNAKPLPTSGDLVESECCREDVLAWEPCPPFQELQQERDELRIQLTATQDGANLIITALKDEFAAREAELKAEIKRWEQSFDGHVYVKDEKYAAFHAQLRSTEARLTTATKALEAIRDSALKGEVCPDVAWFGPVETLHDFCERTLCSLTDGAKP